MKKFIAVLCICMIVMSVVEQNFNAVTGWLAALLFLFKDDDA